MTDQTDNTIHIAFDICLTKDEINDIMCTAVEGGINYWAAATEATAKKAGKYTYEQIANNETLIITLFEPFDENTEKYELTKEKLLKGIKQYLTKNPDEAMHILTIDNNQLIIDTSEVDAGDADAIMQYALFDEIVFA